MTLKKTNDSASKKVFIVDDHPAVRDALTIRISALPDLEVCGEAADVPTAMKLIPQCKPDVAIVDLSLKTGDGLDLIKRIKARDGCPQIVVYSMHDQANYVERALRAGATGFVAKDRPTDELIDAIRDVLGGKVHICRVVAERLLRHAVGRGAAGLEQSPVETLSDREFEVLRLIGLGTKTAEIAEQLRLSVKTVETYRDRIRQKLKLADGTALVHFASQWVFENEAPRTSDGS